MTNIASELIKKLQSRSGQRIACLRFAEELTELLISIDPGQFVDITAKVRRLAIHNFGEVLSKQKHNDLCVTLAANFNSVIDEELVFKIAYIAFIIINKG